MIEKRALLAMGFLCCLTFLVSARADDDDKEPIRPTYPHDDFVVREEMVPMRDGVKLYTLILTPKDANAARPILIERTPYDATSMLGERTTAALDVVLGAEFFGDDYIYVAQDIRGRFKSEGENITMRPPRGAFNNTDTDETTDAWDTVEWLTKNVPSNGKVGIWGTSYPGWLALAALRDPHPALAVAIPFNPVVDVWKADDWFHWGAFRGGFAFNFIYAMETKKDAFIEYPLEKADFYEWMRGLGALGTGLESRVDDRHALWHRLVEDPSYGPYWRAVAADQWFESPPRPVPTLHVHGIWDQEDIYGSPAIYAAMEHYDVNNDMNFFVAGPWYHGQHFSDGSHLGDIGFDEDTAKRFREDILGPFLRRHLHGDQLEPQAPAVVFETGTNRWRSFEQWPPNLEQVRLYLGSNGTLGFNQPEDRSSVTEYISDPANPVPFAPRPNWAVDYSNPMTVAAWRRWLVTDQRFVDGRPDVATWVSEPLKEPITVRGPVTARLIAATSGTDADWVVKFIDVYPDDAPDFEMSGYQLMVCGDIFRGRYREDFEAPRPLAANRALEYSISLPHINHTFKKGHRLMVQIQSSWFPLYDRNPQKFVDSIMTAPPSAYKAERHRIYHERQRETFLEFLVTD